MRNPAEFRTLVVTTKEGPIFTGITWSQERGFFEPITNTRLDEAGFTVTAWQYQEEST